MAHSDLRIVSLIPSATEIVAALGLMEFLVEALNRMSVTIHWKSSSGLFVLNPIWTRRLLVAKFMTTVSQRCFSLR